MTRLDRNIRLYSCLRIEGNCYDVGRFRQARGVHCDASSAKLRAAPLLDAPATGQPISPQSQESAAIAPGAHLTPVDDRARLWQKCTGAQQGIVEPHWARLHQGASGAQRNQTAHNKTKWNPKDLNCIQKQAESN